MIKAIISDFSGVILKPVDINYTGGLNSLNKKLSMDGEYDFWKYFQLNEGLVNFYKSLSRLDVYVFTTGTIQEHPSLKPKLEGVFRDIFSSDRIGLNNKDDEAYKAIINRLDIDPQEILYIDDKQENIDIATKLGIKSIQYISNEQVIDDIKRLYKVTN